MTYFEHQYSNAYYIPKSDMRNNLFLQLTLNQYTRRHAKNNLVPYVYLPILFGSPPATYR